MEGVFNHSGVHTHMDPDDKNLIHAPGHLACLKYALEMGVEVDAISDVREKL